MAPPVRTPRQAWIDAGLAALEEHGPDAVRVEALAARLGVTRGGFYRQFRSRDELLEAMLDDWERRAVDEVLQQVEREGGDPRDRMRRAGMLTFAEDLTPLDLAIRAWARRDPTVAERLRKVDNARMDYLRSMLQSSGVAPDDVEAVALLAFSVMIANRLIKADHPGKSRDEVLVRARHLLLG
ncbi:putative transcriptional regulator, TetR family [Nocardia nova SH22a]|uniref:Putative transcriptional regulator, TetR family n=1 Tax=Nocardia nova SH22a TaxID=1415166 RepID=W5TC71_9NOCA|nr:TetR/AcrR family transcriptional regulator [Nocardia nova]AHH16930.1 putative transcriptional regulator, TetR family [Nocardia nova SH22a]